MERLFIFILLLASCSGHQLQQNSNVEVSQNNTDSNISQNKANNSETNSTEDWAVIVNNEYGQYAKVLAVGKTPDGEAFTSLTLHCPTKKDKENPVISFEYSVNNPDKIPSFNFDYFEGPNAPVLERKLVEIQANSPRGNLYWNFVAAGWYGGFAEVIAFVFSPSTSNKPDKTAQFVRMIAEGSTEVTITVHDYQDNQKVIKTTFPAIDPSSNVARVLNGCRK
jgi:hypothetical protein